MNIDAKFFGAIIFVIVQTCGAIWWASGLSAEVERLAGIQGTAIPALEAEAKQCAIEIHNLHELIKDIDKIEEVVEEVDVAIFRLNSVEDSVKEHSPAIVELQKSLAIANDQMKTILADHEIMGEMLEDMGKTQPAGERRSYGGY